MTTDEAKELLKELIDMDYAAAVDAIRASHLRPVPVQHAHQWFRTGEMKPGQMRCIACGKWGQETHA